MRAAPESFADFHRKAEAGAELSVVFLGGSLTWGANASDPQRTSYRALMADYLRNRYPKSSIAFHDAAIGGTGSLLGIFRLDRDVFAREPDLVFLDFTINDNISSTTPQRLAAYESILQRLIERGILVQVITMGNKQAAVPAFDPSTLETYQAHLKLVEAYQTALGDTLPLLREEGEKGSDRVNELYPFDGIHPDDSGYRVFFEAARLGFETAVESATSPALPSEPVFEARYPYQERIYLRDRELPGGWRKSATYRTSMWFDGLSSRWMDDVILCDVQDNDAVEPLRVEFEGTFVAVFGEANENGLGFRVRIDGEPVLYSPRKDAEPVEVWPLDTSRFGKGNLFVYRVLADDLPPGPHVLELIPDFPDGQEEGQLRIESICVAGPLKE